MNTLQSDTYSSAAIKKILFLIAFWGGNYFILSKSYKDRSEWTLENILICIGVTTLFTFLILIFWFFSKIGGLLLGVILTIVCIFVLAPLENKFYETVNISPQTGELWIGILGIIINLIVLVRLIINIRDYRTVRYFELHETDTNSLDQ